jgi:lysophospholipase L1-like esterase
MPQHNDGIAGQTTSQVLARFSTTVLNHGYQRVIILCGTNDILQNTSNLTTELTANLQAMARIATNANIEVVLSELPPATSNGVDLDAVNAVNSAIIALAARDGYLLVDYNTPMVGHPEYFVDGVHPNAAGYAVMEKALAGVVLH